MVIITSIIGRLPEMGWTETVDWVELTSEERASAHFVTETEAGRPIRVSLERGVELQDGDVLAVDGDIAIAIRAKPEHLLLVRPGTDPILWWAACYQLGNFHRPARFLADGILTPDDPLAAQMLRALGLAAERVHVPFVGRRFGAAGAHHHLHHDHHHDGATPHDHAHGGHAHDHPGHRHG
ncbi:urease accessory protein UreE [Chelatococcus reniformis]|uniref:Urease accessory protein UreE n=1 Tax=Chelatococcus reniformis TaxID=1494448 RepID=A0A916U4H1_9HYPH|nr:urease accessory protein UreE [Chelatococcus reniformis]GGC59017.1 hypothetical protein GCM10010994_17290 [Chelatococcus reniformis]